jgi:hypothetical protein
MSRVLTEEQRLAKNARNREYRKNNPEVAKAWYRDNKEKHYENGRQWKKDNPTRVKELAKVYNKRVKERSANDINLSLSRIINQAKGRSKTHNREFNIDLSYIKRLWSIQHGLCKYTKLPMSLAIGSKSARASLDRIDSKQGYVKGNCQLVLFGINSFKSETSELEFIKLCKAVAENN